MTTTTIRIDDHAQWRAGDILTVLDADGKEILRGVLAREDNTAGLYLAGHGGAVRFGDGRPAGRLARDGLTYTITRETPALPTEPNTILLDVEVSDGTVYPLVRVANDGDLSAYDAQGWPARVIDPADVTAYTPATLVPGERVTR